MRTHQALRAHFERRALTEFEAASREAARLQAMPPSPERDALLREADYNECFALGVLAQVDGMVDSNFVTPRSLRTN